MIITLSATDFHIIWHRKKCGSVGKREKMHAAKCSIWLNVSGGNSLCYVFNFPVSLRIFKIKA
jgi:hypothetical protein